MYYYIPSSSLLLAILMLIPIADAGKDYYTVTGHLYSSKRDGPASGAQVDVISYEKEASETCLHTGTIGKTNDDGLFSVHNAYMMRQSEVYLTKGHMGYKLRVTYEGEKYEMSIFCDFSDGIIDIGKEILPDLPDPTLKDLAKKLASKVNNAFRHITKSKGSSNP